MSYLDSINNPITITTGDGVKYSSQKGLYGLKILQQSISFDTTYQLAKFNFINVPGTLVAQTVPMGRVFPLEIYFDGIEHLKFANNFWLSTNDKRPWTIEHPIYGIILVKTEGLKFDNAALSFTKITGTLLETIGGLPQGSSLLPLDQVPLLTEAFYEDAELSFTQSPPVTPPDITTWQQDMNSAFQKFVPVIKIPEDFEKINNAYNTAINYITIATDAPILAMRSTMQVYLLPAQFVVAVRQRLDVLIDVFNTLRQTIFGVVNVSSKNIYQNKAGAIVASICEAAATPIPNTSGAGGRSGDYRNSSDVLQVIAQLVEVRNNYYTDLDSLQTANGGSLLSFIPNATAIQSLNTLVNTTITALYTIALSSKSRRSMVCEKDTNLILLAHRLYGLDNNDNNINDLIDNNGIGDEFNTPGIGLNELVIVEKGREIIYYV